MTMVRLSFMDKASIRNVTTWTTFTLKIELIQQDDFTVDKRSSKTNFNQYFNVPKGGRNALKWNQNNDGKELIQVSQQ